MLRSVVARARAVPWTVTRIMGHPANDGGRAVQLARFVRVRATNRLLGRTAWLPYGRSSIIAIPPTVPAAIAAARAPIPDYSEMLAWERLLRPGDQFIDVGAHIGMYTLWAAECGAHVIAVEPADDAATWLQRNCERNQAIATVYRVALAEEAGHVMLSSDANQAKRHLVMTRDDSAQSVPSLTLDELAASEGLKQIAGVKVDVEGAEELVLRGASKLLAEKRVAAWQLEWNDMSMRHFGRTRAPCADILLGAGYRLYRPNARGQLHPVQESHKLGRDIFALARREHLR